MLLGGDQGLGQALRFSWVLGYRCRWLLVFWQPVPASDHYWSAAPPLLIWLGLTWGVFIIIRWNITKNIQENKRVNKTLSIGPSHLHKLVQGSSFFLHWRLLLQCPVHLHLLNSLYVSDAGGRTVQRGHISQCLAKSSIDPLSLSKASAFIKMAFRLAGLVGIVGQSSNWVFGIHPQFEWHLGIVTVWSVCVRCCLNI